MAVNWWHKTPTLHTCMPYIICACDKKALYVPPPENRVWRLKWWRKTTNHIKIKADSRKNMSQSVRGSCSPRTKRKMKIPFSCWYILQHSLKNLCNLMCIFYKKKSPPRFMSLKNVSESHATHNYIRCSTAMRAFSYVLWGNIICSAES